MQNAQQETFFLTFYNAKDLTILSIGLIIPAVATSTWWLTFKLPLVSLTFTEAQNIGAKAVLRLKHKNMIFI